MGDFFVKLAYKTESSRRYKKFKNFLENILENNHSNYKKIFDFFMIFLVISTVGILIYEVKNPIPDELMYYEYFAVFIFILEWIGRYIISFESHTQVIKDYEEAQYLNLKYDFSHSLKIILKNKFAYIISPASIIDLLAILPTFRPLRILRIFLLLRLFKLLRYTNSINQLLRIFVEKKLELTFLLILYCLIVFFSATVIYVFEGDGGNPQITNYLDAIYWAFVTVATIGYGDITPNTEVGRFVVYILIIAGLTAAAFFTAIVTSAMTTKLDFIRKNKTLSKAMKLKKYTLVCGYGRTAQVLVDNLIENFHEVVIIEEDMKLCSKAIEKDLHCICDDASSIELLQNIGIMSSISDIVILTNDDTVNLSIILSIRSINKHIKITTRCNSSKTKNKLLLAGANETIELNKSASLVGMGYLKSPIAYEAMDDLLIDYKGANINELEIFHNSPFINKQLKSINFDKFNLTFIAIAHNLDRENIIFNPNKDETIIKEKDFLIVIGYKKTINQFKNYLQSPTNFKE
jgi:voltage-gated potassium channel